MPFTKPPAYPRLKSSYNRHELEVAFTPSDAELKFINKTKRHPDAKWSLLILLKTFQKLGFFIKLSEVPESIGRFLTDYVSGCTWAKKKLKPYDQGSTRQRLIKSIRSFTGVKPYDQGAEKVLIDAAGGAAKSRETLPDVINVAIDQLVKNIPELRKRQIKGHGFLMPQPTTVGLCGLTSH